VRFARLRIEHGRMPQMRDSFIASAGLLQGVCELKSQGRAVAAERNGSIQRFNGFFNPAML
jgi:hypothetical protein